MVITIVIGAHNSAFQKVIPQIKSQPSEKSSFEMKKGVQRLARLSIFLNSRKLRNQSAIYAAQSSVKDCVIFSLQDESIGSTNNFDYQK